MRQPGCSTVFLNDPAVISNLSEQRVATNFKSRILRILLSLISFRPRQTAFKISRVDHPVYLQYVLHACDTGKLHLLVIDCLGDNAGSFREDIRYSSAVLLNLPRMLAILGRAKQKLRERRMVQEGKGVGGRRPGRADK